jgi:hypothetical protein
VSEGLVVNYILLVANLRLVEAKRIAPPQPFLCVS